MSVELSPNGAKGNVQQSKDVLVADLKRVVSDADDLMKEVVNSTSEELSAARQRIEARLGEARARVDEARVVAKRKVCNAASSADAYVKQNPWTVVGVVSALSFIGAFLLINRAGRRSND